MKKNNDRSSLSCLFTLLCVSVLIVGISQTASADIVPYKPGAKASMKTGINATIEVMASTHAISEVRDAIEAVRQGNHATAVPVLEKHAKKGDIGATFVLAKLHQAGLGVEKSEKIAADYLQSNADSGHAPSLIALGEIREQSDPTEAISLYKKAAAKGDATGYLKLADIFERGLFGKKANPKLAFSNYKKSAEAEHAVGMFHLARCYDKGIGTSPNELLATRTFLKSALKGLALAQVKMARRYYEGKGLEKDPIAAFGWLSLASQSGSTEAMILLGRRYEAGDIIPQNLDLAGQLYSKAAKRGDPTGKYYLALLYANGKGTKQDLVRAYILLHSSAKSLPMAQEALTKLEPNLTDTQKDEAEKRIAQADAKKAG